MSWSPLTSQPEESTWMTLTPVVQVDPPDDFKSYVHRSGRTGRAGKTGTVITLTTRSRSRRVTDLLKQAGISARLEDMRPSDISQLELV